MTRPLIFDMDGTLVDSCVICVDILNSMLRDRGHEAAIDPIAARAYMSLGGTQMISGLLGASCGDPAEDLADFRARYQRTPTPQAALFPGVAEGLRRLHQTGFTLSICSNKPQNLCEQVLDNIGLADLFRLVVGGQPGLRSKPAPDLLEAALSGLGANARDCIFVGDSELDHQVAIEARMPFLFVAYGYASEGWLPHGSDSFDCFDAMTDAIMLQPDRYNIL